VGPERLLRNDVVARIFTKTAQRNSNNPTGRSADRRSGWFARCEMRFEPCDSLFAPCAIRSRRATIRSRRAAVRSSRAQFVSVVRRSLRAASPSYLWATYPLNRTPSNARLARTAVALTRTGVVRNPM
jgi:hypothetical protein